MIKIQFNTITSHSYNDPFFVPRISPEEKFGFMDFTSLTSLFKARAFSSELMDLLFGFISGQLMVSIQSCTFLPRRNAPSLKIFIIIAQSSIYFPHFLLQIQHKKKKKR